MATKPRYQKTLTQLWVYDNAKRLGLTDADLAQATGVKTGTARSWFSRGKPNADAIPALERLFGRPAPEDDAQPTGQSDVAAAIDRQTEVIKQLLDEQRLDRVAQETVAEALGELAGMVARLLNHEGTPAGVDRLVGAGTPR